MTTELSSKYRRISLYGGPGASKSTTAALLYANLKLLRQQQKCPYTIELVREYAKELVYQKVDIKAEMQHDILLEQYGREFGFLHFGVDLIVTDSPLWLSVIYGRKLGTSKLQEVIEDLKKVDAVWPSLNIFITRPDSFDSHGRLQDRKEAEVIDGEIMNLFHEFDLAYIVCKNYDEVWQSVIALLGLK